MSAGLPPGGPASAPSRRRRLAALVGPPLLSLASLGVALALAEGAFELLLARPALLRHLPRTVKRHLRNYYLAYDRDLIQANPRSSRYDPELFYTLRPGRFRFASREFDVAFEVNRLGVRDTEDALRAPEVVLAGDSFAMGWGVEAEETFARLVQARTGLRVLNAAVSSYGTARELLLLRRVDTRRMRFLVIQYDRNDAWENSALVRHGGRLPIRPRERYEGTLIRSPRKRRYWPGRHTFEIVRAIVHPHREPLEDPVPPPDAQARLFVATLRALLPSGPYGLIVFELSPAAPPDDAFARALRAEVVRPDQPEIVRRARVVELGGVLRPEHYFDLDDHLRPSGHRVVADEIVKAMAHIGASD